MHTLYPGTDQRPLETNFAVFSSIEGSAAATSSCYAPCQHPAPCRYNTEHSVLQAVSITYQSKVFERSSGLDVRQGSFKISELQVDLLLGSLSILDSLNLESLDGLQLASNVILGGLEGVEALLDLVDNGLVLED